MINLKDIGYPNIKEIYLFDFVPGSGGDMFITLASRCSGDFVNSWKDDSVMQERMEEFEETMKMPGNNISGKLFEFNTIREYKQQILAGLYKIGGSDATKISFCTHPTGNNVNTRISDVLAHCFPEIPITRVGLFTNSLISKQFTLYSYYDRIDFDGYYNDWMCSRIDRLQDKTSRFIYWEDPENSFLIDHIDLFINDQIKFKQAVLEFADMVNWNWYSTIIEIYTRVKVEPFLKWYSNNYGT